MPSAALCSEVELTGRNHFAASAPCRSVETAEEVTGVLREAMKNVPVERLLASTNVAYGKLRAIAGGAAVLRKELGIKST